MTPISKSVSKSNSQPEANPVDLTQMLGEVVELCSALIQIDSTNTGDPTTIGPGESECATLIQQQLEDVGYTTDWFERIPGRGNLIVRVPGTDPALPALLFHAHTDVVTANEEEWRFSPFSGAVHDGQVWGRGAVDMKNMIAMLIAVLRQLAREKFRPRRDLVFAFVADEEVESEYGMRFLVEQHPEVFEGVTEANWEVSHSTPSAGVSTQSVLQKKELRGRRSPPRVQRGMAHSCQTTKMRWCCS